MRAWTLALVLLAAAGAVAAAPKPAPRIVSAQGTATIDGVDAPGEWSGAAREDFRLNDSGAPASFLVMNDATSLYLAVRVGTRAPGWSDVLVNFDDDGDGIPAEGDDGFRIYAWNGSYRSLSDSYYTKKLPCPVGIPACWGIDDAEAGGSTDARAAAGSDGSSMFYEIAKPLDSADDAHDFSLAAGDLVAVLANSQVDLCDGITCSHTGIPGPVPVVIMPFAPPTVASVAPTRGRPGAVVTLRGSHLAGASSVAFHGIGASFESTGNTEIAAVVPEGASTGPIVVTTPGGTAATAPFVVAVPGPVIGAPTTEPRTLRAGGDAVVSFRVTRSDSGGVARGATVACDPSLGGRVLAHRERIVAGVATLRFHLPAATSGRTLIVRLTARWQGRTASRTATFRIA